MRTRAQLANLIADAREGLEIQDLSNDEIDELVEKLQVAEDELREDEAPVFSDLIFLAFAVISSIWGLVVTAFYDDPHHGAMYTLFGITISAIIRRGRNST